MKTTQKKIVLFGAGKSATVLIEYLLHEAATENWHLVLIDADINTAQSKIGKAAHGTAMSFDIKDDSKRNEIISVADIVISLLPPALHAVVAKDCVQLNKKLLTASYVDDEIKKLSPAIEEKHLLFLCEMGLDPGIDHMSAMKIIDAIHARGGVITSFKSHCGGLVAPESDDNPWRYKISWNPRNVVLAGKAGAHFKENDVNKHITYEEIFNSNHAIDIEGLDTLGYYPNRDSLSYIPLYGLQSAPTFIRTTLRYKDFMYGWKNVVELKLTDETQFYETDNKTLYEVFKEHMDKNGFGPWLEKKLTERFAQTKSILENLMQMMEAETELEEMNEKAEKEFMTVDEKGNLAELSTDDVKDNAAAYMAAQMHEANLTLKQLFYLGLDDEETMINKGNCSIADVLQFALEKKLVLQPADKDMVVMVHEIDYELNGEKKSVNSSLIVKGKDNLHTAMAKTVGLPLGIAAKFILNGTIKTTGLHIPTKKEIYEPVLKELEKHNIIFKEKNH